MAKVLVPPPTFTSQCPRAVQTLNNHGIEIVQNQHGLPFDFDIYRDVFPEIEAVICGVEEWTAERIAMMPKLKIISKFGVGVDNIDLNAAKQRGVYCTNAIGENTYSVAEFTVALLLCLTRRVVEFNSLVKNNFWIKKQGVELSGKTVGLVGFGAIAQRVAAMLSVFNVNIIAYDKYPNKQAFEALGVRLSSLKEVVSSSDFLTLHVPGNSETYHLINDDTISQMKTGAMLVNVSRGMVVNEVALYKALTTGKLAAAASDVFETEPVNKNNPLLTLDNFICSPHIAAATKEANERISDTVAQAIIDTLQGRIPNNIVNA